MGLGRRLGQADPDGKSGVPGLKKTLGVPKTIAEGPKSEHERGFFGTTKAISARSMAFSCGAVSDSFCLKCLCEFPVLPGSRSPSGRPRCRSSGVWLPRAWYRLRGDERYGWSREGTKRMAVRTETGPNGTGIERRGPKSSSDFWLKPAKIGAPIRVFGARHGIFGPENPGSSARVSDNESQGVSAACRVGRHR